MVFTTLKYFLQITALTSFLSAGIAIGQFPWEKAAATEDLQIRTDLSSIKADASFKVRADALLDEAAELVKSKSYSQALEKLEQAREIYHQLGLVNDEGNVLFQMSIFGQMAGYDAQTNIKKIEEARKLFKLGNDLLGICMTHYQLGNIFYMNEKIPQAREEFEMARSIFQRGGNNMAGASSIFNLEPQVLLPIYSMSMSLYAYTFIQTGEYKRAEQIIQEIDSLAPEDNWASAIRYAVLGDISKKYHRDPERTRFYYTKLIQSMKQPILGDSEEVLFMEAFGKLIISEASKELGIPFKNSQQNDQNPWITVPLLQALSQNSIGDSYFNEGRYDDALKSYEQGLHELKPGSSNGLERTLLGSIADVMRLQGKPDTAITFYKQAINIIEETRESLKSLKEEEQKKYFESVESDYRNLIKLLIDKGRIPEAELVLDLLKDEELNLNRERTTFDGKKIKYNRVEETIVNSHKSLVEFGVKLRECNNQCAELTVLDSQFKELNKFYLNQIQALDDQNNRPDRIEEARSLLDNSREIVQNPGTVLLQPFFYKSNKGGEEKDEILMLWTANEVVNYIKIEPSGKKISQMVLDWRTLMNKKSDREEDKIELNRLGQELYKNIILPIEKIFEGKPIQHIVFSPDRELRYLPLAALHDGSQYLIQKYKISNIIRSSETDMSREKIVADKNRVAAFALPKNASEPLDYAEKEVREISDNPISDGTFTLENVARKARSASILHLATHGGYDGKSSYLQMGGGTPDKLTSDNFDRELTRIKNLDLVVLSACNTALGGNGNGKEVNSLNYEFMRNKRSKAVLSSLWRVNDESTSTFMKDFYEELRFGGSRSESLANVQRKFIQNPRFNHPYYWSAFVLFGNSN